MEECVDVYALDGHGRGVAFRPHPHPSLACTRVATQVQDDPAMIVAEAVDSVAMINECRGSLEF